MPDLFSHFAVGFSIGKVIGDRKTRILFYIGNFLPDIVFKTFIFFTSSSTWYCEPSHSHLMLIPICLLIAHLFQENLRKKAFLMFLAGSYLHILMDLGKNYMGQGVIPWAFPFSMDRIELGLYYPEDCIYFMLPAFLLICLAEVVDRTLFRKLKNIK